MKNKEEKIFNKFIDRDNIAKYYGRCIRNEQEKNIFAIFMFYSQQFLIIFFFYLNYLFVFVNFDNITKCKSEKDLDKLNVAIFFFPSFVSHSSHFINSIQKKD